MNNHWFKVGDVNMQWLARSPANKTSRCDQCDTVISPNVRRLRIDNGKGPDRKRGKGKRHSYVCRSCSFGFTKEVGYDDTT